jgi:hypothetical protein
MRLALGIPSKQWSFRDSELRATKRPCARLLDYWDVFRPINEIFKGSEFSIRLQESADVSRLNRIVPKEPVGERSEGGNAKVTGAGYRRTLTLSLRYFKRNGSKESNTR